MHEYNGIICENFLDCLEYVRDKREFTVCCRFTSDYDYEYLFKLIFELGNITLLLEEAEIYISPGSTSSNFLDLVRYGRHKNIEILGIARRASELSINFRAQVNKIYSFKQTELRDMEILEKLGFTNLNKLAEHEYSEINL